MYRTILVPLDGTPEAARALPHAVQVAEAAGAGARILLVRPAPAPDGGHDSAPGFTAVAEASAYLREVASDLAGRGLDVTALTPAGPVAASIVQDAERHQADLIVTATHGRAGLDRLLHGSVAGDILQHVAMPVLVVGPLVATPRPPRRILVPLDGDAFSAAVVAPVAELARGLGAAVDLVGVVPALPVAIGDEDGPVPDGLLERLQVRRAGSGHVMLEGRQEVQERLQALERALRFWADRLAAGAPSVQVHTAYGLRGPSVAAVISTLGRELEADLIALRTHARPTVGRFLVGSVADEVVRTAPLPALLFPPRAVPEVELAYHAGGPA
jgi:nucleotide-binding universal stress UspA family protein